MSGLRSLTEASDLSAYEMPILQNDLRGKAEYMLADVPPNLIYRHAGLKDDDKGPEVRAKILSAYTKVFDSLVKQWAEDGDTLRQAQFEQLLPKLKKKLVWKKVR